MIVYESTKEEFIDNVLEQTLIDKLIEAYRKKIGKVNNSELSSWKNSLMFMYQVLEDSEIPNSTGVALEYQIPYAKNRIDVILTGKDIGSKNTAVVIELKQWTEVEQTEEKVGYVVTLLGGNKQPTEHPSYQAWSYAYMLENYNMAVRENEYKIQPCAFLHNYSLGQDDNLLDIKYSRYFIDAPIFAKGDIKKLRGFIKKYIHYGDNLAGLYIIDNGKIAPSKMLQDALKSMLKGNKEFVLIGNQFLVYEKGLYFAKQSFADNQKRVLIVKGGPGTGKSVVAINLLVDLMNEGLNVQYVTKNENPRNVYMEKLQGEFKKVYIKNLFRGSATYVNAELNEFDVLICDEAHRLMKDSGRFFPGSDSQIDNIIKASKCSVFFIDELQRVNVTDSGRIDTILEIAEKYYAKIDIMELESQFRCNGSDGYLLWLEDVLQIKETANSNYLGMDYTIQILDSPNELYEVIEKKSRKNNKSRLVAGYCWDWIGSGKHNKNVFDIRMLQYNFEMSWNIPTGTWAIDEGSVNQVGCIHTCQGLEFEYVGVIIGEDLRYENGKVITDFTKRAKTDHSIKGLKGLYKNDPIYAEKTAEEIIKNTYRTLMSRGMKGCYIFCTDKGLSDYLKWRIKGLENVDYTGEMDGMEIFYEDTKTKYPLV